GILFHPVLCDTYIQYDSIMTPSKNNSRVSFESQPTYNGLISIPTNYRFNNHFSILMNLYFHNIEENWIGNPDTVIKYNSFWNNPVTAERYNLHQISISSGFEYSYHDFSISLESMILVVQRKRKYVSTLFNGTEETSYNNDYKFQRF